MHGFFKGHVWWGDTSFLWSCWNWKYIIKFSSKPNDLFDKGRWLGKCKIDVLVLYP